LNGSKSAKGSLLLLLLLLLLLMPGFPPIAIGVEEEGKLALSALKESKGEGFTAPMVVVLLEEGGAAVPPKLNESKPLS
jgi:hypothetical protein